MFRTPALLIACFLVASAALGQTQAPAPPEIAGAKPIAVPSLRPFGTGADSRLLFNGQQFLAVFSDSRYGDQDVLGQRYDGGGAPLEQQAFPIAATYLIDSTPVPIWNGTDYAVFSHSLTLGTFRLRVSADGGVGGAGDPLPDVYGYAVDGAWNGSRYCAAFLNSEQLTLRFFDASLGVTRAIPIDTAAEAVQNTAVATDGRNFLVVSETLKSDGRRGLYALVIDDEGNLLSGLQTLAIEAASTPTSTFPRLSPAISWNGSRYLVAWAAPAALKATFVTPAGNAAGPFVINARPLTGSVTATWDGIAHLIAWSDRDTGEVSGAIASSAGELIDAFNLGAATTRAVAASNGDSFLVLAGTDRFAVHSTGTVRFERLGATTMAYAAQTDASITAGEGNLLAAWVENGDVYASRIRPDGAALDGSGIRLGPSRTGIATASSGDVHAVAWSDTLSTRFARLTASGELIDAGGSVIANSSGSVVMTGGHALMAAVSVPAGNVPTNLFNIVVQPIPTTGIAPAAVTIASNTAVRQLQAIVETPHGFALLWQQDLDPECISSRCKKFAERLMFLSDTGGVTRDLILPFNPVVFLGAAADESGILLAGSSGTLITQRIAFDGAVGPLITSDTALAAVRGTLVTHATGFRLFIESSGVSTLLLDPDGHAISPLARLRSGTFAAAARGFGAAWMTWLAPWNPLPNAHPGGATRAFVEIVPDHAGRRRAAAKL